jgi:hypothetical protein
MCKAATSLAAGSAMPPSWPATRPRPAAGRPARSSSSPPGRAVAEQIGRRVTASPAAQRGGAGRAAIRRHRHSRGPAGAGPRAGSGPHRVSARRAGPVTRHRQALYGPKGSVISDHPPCRLRTAGSCVSGAHVGEQIVQHCGRAGRRAHGLVACTKVPRLAAVSAVSPR